jgi:hypothetical protein
LCLRVRRQSRGFLRRHHPSITTAIAGPILTTMLGHWNLEGGVVPPDPQYAGNHMGNQPAGTQGIASGTGKVRDGGQRDGGQAA